VKIRRRNDGDKIVNAEKLELKEGHVIRFKGSPDLYKIVYEFEGTLAYRLCFDDARYSVHPSPSKFIYPEDSRDNIEIVWKVNLDVDF
jgi:hypothetical protein